MSDRETKEITTPRGHTLVINTYITGREARALRVPYLKQADEFPKEMIDEKGLRASISETAQNLALKMVIVSFDGKKDGADGFDLVDVLLSLPTPEFKFIVNTIDAVMLADEEQKKTS
jgi:hypothetical protein